VAGPGSALHEPDGGCPGVESAAPQFCGPIVGAIATHGNPSAQRCFADEDVILGRDHTGLVNLEHRDAGRPADSVRPRIAARCEQDELACTGRRSGFERLVVEAGADLDDGRRRRTDR
jgi:hypothetical protein